MSSDSFKEMFPSAYLEQSHRERLRGVPWRRIAVATVYLIGFSGWGQPGHAGRGRIATNAEAGERPLPDRAVCRFGTTRWRHPGAIQRLAFAPNNHWIATAGQGGTCIWETKTGKELGRLRESRQEISLLLFSPDSKRIAVGTPDGLIRICMAPGLEPVTRIAGDKGEAETGAFSPDGGTFFKPAANTVTRWDVPTGTNLGRFVAHRGAVRALAVAPKRNWLASGGDDGSINVWELPSCRRVAHLQGHTWPVEFVAFSVDGSALVSASTKGSYYYRELFLWDVGAGTKTAILTKRNRDPRSLAISPDGNDIAVGCVGGNVHLLGRTDLVKAKWSRDENGIIEAAAFSPDGKVLALGGADQVVRLWDVTTGAPVNRLGWEHQDWVTSVAFARGDNVVISGSPDHTIRAWDTGIGGASRQIPCEDYFGTFAVDPGGDLLAQVDFHGVSLWDLRSLAVHARIPETEPLLVGFPQFLGFAGTSKRLIAAEGAHITLCDLEARKVLLESEEWQLINHYHYGLSPDGSFLATSYQPCRFPEELSCTVTCLSLHDGRERVRVPVTGQAVTSVACSPLGKKLAYGCRDGVVRVLDTSSGRPLHEMRLASGQVSCCVFSADGKTLATAGADRCVRLWEMATGRVRRTFAGHAGEVTCLCFSSDGKRLASGSKDTTVLLWDVSGRSRSMAAPQQAEGRLEALWEDLGAEDAARAYDATWLMAGVPAAALPFLKARLSPVQRVEPARIRQWIKDLDDARFSVRVSAQKSLASADDLAVPLLQEARKKGPSLEASRRIKTLLEQIRTKPSQGRIRAIRAIETLEKVGTVQAAEALAALSQGTPESEVTQEAKAAIERLRSKGRYRP